MRKRVFIVAVSVFFAANAWADNAVRQHLPNAQEVGHGRLSLAFWDVYDATLYAPEGVWNAQKPAAISIRYFREIEGSDIADRSIEEMKKQGFTDSKILAEWHQQMINIFPDVTNGTELTAILTDTRSTDFYRDGHLIGRIKDPKFGTYFFNIWLSAKTSEPQLRKELLGLK